MQLLSLAQVEGHRLALVNYDILSHSFFLKKAPVYTTAILCAIMSVVCAPSSRHATVGGSGSHIRRIHAVRRPDADDVLEDAGLSFHTPDGEVYWNESARYEMSAEHVTNLADAAADVHSMCMAAVAYVMADDSLLLDAFGMEDWLRLAARTSWDADERALFGRMDFCHTEDGFKFLEYNAETPLTLIESGAASDTLEEPQFNHLQSCIHARLESIAESEPWETLWLIGSLSDAEERDQLLHMSDVASDYFKVCVVDTEVMQWGECLKDDRGNVVTFAYTLLPFVWFTEEQQACVNTVRWLQPPWTAVMASKAILPLLWHMWPHHPSLVPAYQDAAEALADDEHADARTWVAKPLDGRGGDGVGVCATIHECGEHEILQEYANPLLVDGHSITLGVWVVGGQSAAVSVREDKGTAITTADSMFVPHVVVGAWGYSQPPQYSQSPICDPSNALAYHKCMVAHLEAQQVPPQYAQQVPPQYAQQVPPQYAHQVPPQYAQQVPPQYAQQVPPQYAQQVPQYASVSPLVADHYLDHHEARHHDDDKRHQTQKTCAA